MKCQWCGMEREIIGKPFINWKCGSRQNSKGTRTQSEACVEIAALKTRNVLLEKVAEATDNFMNIVNLDKDAWAEPVWLALMQTDEVLAALRDLGVPKCA